MKISGYHWKKKLAIIHDLRKNYNDLLIIDDIGFTKRGIMKTEIPRRYPAKEQPEPGFYKPVIWQNTYNDKNLPK